jgi:hypothetical protein
MIWAKVVVTIIHRIIRVRKISLILLLIRIKFTRKMTKIINQYTMMITLAIPRIIVWISLGKNQI